MNTLIGLGIEDFPTGMTAAGALLQYLYDTQKTDLAHFTHLYPYLTNKYMAPPAEHAGAASDR